MRDEARFTEHETGNIHRPYFIMELRLTLWQELLISAAMMLVLILIVVHFNVPNPNMILIAGLVVSAALFGYNGGLLAGALMLVYSMYFFSTDHSYVHYTTLNFEKLIVILIGIVVVLLFVCELKRSSMRAFNEIDDLTQRLQEDNMLLKELSLNDALTGIRNRLALRHDFNAYIGREKAVPGNNQEFLGISAEQGERFWQKTLEYYFGTTDQEKLREIETRAAIVGELRLMAKAIKSYKGTDYGEKQIAASKAFLESAVPKTNDLSLARFQAL